MKLFKTSNIEAVAFCQDQFGRDVSINSTVSSLSRKMSFVS